jgi:hypothetical protein
MSKPMLLTTAVGTPAARSALRVGTVSAYATQPPAVSSRSYNASARPSMPAATVAARPV